VTCPHCGAANADGARFCGVCGGTTSATEPSHAGAAPPGVLPPEYVGREIGGRYRILAKLGEGGMGAVYRGEQISLKRKCAIKLLKPELSSDAGLVKRFNAEAELVAKLSHPNIVGIYDFGQDRDGTLFIAMEFLEGRTLREALIADGPMPPRRAVAIASQIASSLTDAHAHGIVHRDLKPDNVMLTERGREKDVVRVLDFGIAKLRDEGKNTVQQMTQAGDLVGTPQYMAPEQIRGDKIDGRTDVYALGAMLYEMVTGRLPFEGPTVMAILSKHLTETTPPPSVRRPDLQIPPSIDALVMASLVKDASQRVPSMEMVGEQLAAIGSLLGSPSQPFVVPQMGGVMGGPSGWQPGMPTAQSGAVSGGLVAPTPPPHATPYGAYPALPQPQPLSMPPTMGTPPPMHAPSAAPRKSRAALWVVLGVVAVAAIAIVAVVSKSSSQGGAGSASGGGSASGTAEDPWAKPSTNGGGGDDEPVTFDASDSPAPDGTTYHAPTGWSMIVPPGYGPVQTNTTNGLPVTSWDTKLAGQDAGIAVIEVPTPATALTDDQLLASARAFATQVHGSLVTADFQTYGGARHLRAIYDLPNARAEAVLYLGIPSSYVVMFGAVTRAFEDAQPLRREIFDRRFSPP
jgi:serine/threonine-protein kinase